MSIETELVTVLKTQCANTYPDTAPITAPRPFVVWRHMGGDPLRYMDGTAAAQRHATILVEAWASTRQAANELMLAIEGALCTAGAFTCDPQAAFSGAFDDDLSLYSAQQEFSILGTR